MGEAPVEETVMDAALSDPEQPWKQGPVWYFAYGSNMKAATMTNRGITPLEVKAVRVDGYYLTFDIFGIPFSEPSYASIEAFPNSNSVQLFWKSKYFSEVPPVCGIAYLLSPQDFHALLITEGSGVVYDLIETRAELLGTMSQEKITVYTLKAKRPMKPNACPSERYMDIFRAGAEAMNLPLAYVHYLESLPRYSKQTPIGSGIFAYYWRPLLKQVVRLTKWRVDVDGNCPRSVATLIFLLYESMWVYHDYVHQHLFESGDGGKLEFREGRAKKS